MKQRTCKQEYLEKAQQLSHDEIEVILSRMRNKVYSRLKKENLPELEMVGIQLEIEDEQLTEWREKMQSIRAKETKSKESPKSKSKDK